MPAPDEADDEDGAEASGDALSDGAAADAEGDVDGPALPPSFELPHPDRISTIITTNTRLALHMLFIFFIPFLPDSLFI